MSGRFALLLSALPKPQFSAFKLRPFLADAFASAVPLIRAAVAALIAMLARKAAILAIVERFFDRASMRPANAAKPPL